MASSSTQTTISGFAEEVFSSFLGSSTISKSEHTKTPKCAFEQSANYLKLEKILKAKLTNKNRLAFGKPACEKDLLQALLNFTVALKRHGTLFIGSTDVQTALGLPLRTPSYLTTMFCVHTLLKYGCIELGTEQCGLRVLVKGQSCCLEVSEHLARLVERNSN